MKIFTMQLRNANDNCRVLIDNELKEVDAMGNINCKAYNRAYNQPIRFMTHNYKKYSGGTVETYLNVNHGVVAECQMYGEFMAVKPASEVAKQLVGCKYRYDNVLKVLQNFEISDYFGSVKAEDVAACICSGDHSF